jgi:uncharacterized BrkB/YihY/UPF0761 family membrane protein
MSRAYRVLALVPAVLVVLNVLSVFAAASPCLPDPVGCG